ncbi:MAG: hypothetical protein Ct9H300mP10_06130 [Methanobacteriota archaeon]|nr:MAG: hypothetical protein Ct9H300mP10_06130 [Euryarchaeota archaeon]
MTIWLGDNPLLGHDPGQVPGRQFLCTGTGGPGNNAHGPDEKLHIPASKRLTAVLSAPVAAVSR